MTRKEVRCERPLGTPWLARAGRACSNRLHHEPSHTGGDGARNVMGGACRAAGASAALPAALGAAHARGASRAGRAGRQWPACWRTCPSR